MHWRISRHCVLLDLLPFLTHVIVSSNQAVNIPRHLPPCGSAHTVVLTRYVVSHPSESNQPGTLVQECKPITNPHGVFWHQRRHLTTFLSNGYEPLSRTLPGMICLHWPILLCLYNLHPHHHLNLQPPPQIQYCVVKIMSWSPQSVAEWQEMIPTLFSSQSSSEGMTSMCWKELFVPL